MDKKMILLALVLVAAALGTALGYYYFSKSEAPAVIDTATQGVLPSIGEAANPLSDKPDINPTSKTNPFDSVKTNPFQ